VGAHARSTVFTVNPGCSPPEAPRLRAALRRLLGGAPVSVRVASDHLELAALAPRSALERAAETLAGPAIALEAPPAVQPLEAYLWLLGRERFWEAHEVLEPLWASTRDPALRALILAAAALVRAQEGSLRGAERNASLLDSLGSPAVDVECIRGAALRAAAALPPGAHRCVRAWWRKDKV